MNLSFSLILASRSKTGQTRKKICPESLTKAVKEVKNECSLKKLLINSMCLSRLTCSMCTARYHKTGVFKGSQGWC